MSGKHSPGATSPGEETGGATSIATVVLALLTALGLAGVAIVGVGQFSGQRQQASSDAIVKVQPPPPVAVPPPAKAVPSTTGPSQGRATKAQSRVVALLSGGGSALPRFLTNRPNLASPDEAPSSAPRASTPVATLTPQPSAGRILSLGRPAAGHSWTGIKAGQSWSGIKKGQSWSGVKVPPRKRVQQPSTSKGRLETSYRQPKLLAMAAPSVELKRVAEATYTRTERKAKASPTSVPSPVPTTQTGATTTPPVLSTEAAAVATVTARQSGKGKQTRPAKAQSPDSGGQVAVTGNGPKADKRK